MDPNPSDPLLGARRLALVLHSFVELAGRVRGEEQTSVAFFRCDRNTKFVEARAAAVLDVVEIDEQRRERLAAPSYIFRVGRAVRVVMWG